jgi:UDP-N-acetylmuramoylalanine--D-glutamate ligase
LDHHDDVGVGRLVYVEIALMNLNGAKVLVLGLGETGLSMARFVARRGASRVRVADSRARPPGADELTREVPSAEHRFGAFEHATFQGIDLVAISPGVPLAEPTVQAAIARGVPVVGDIELFAQAIVSERGASKVVAITGTNGKTTVTALTGALCAAAGMDVEVAGNISPAALTALMAREDAGTRPDLWVLELSSYQLETTHSLAADAATMLNLSEDHLDRYASLAAYGEAKSRIFADCPLRVLNRDDAASRAMRGASSNVVTFGLDEPPSGRDYGLHETNSGFAITRGTERVLATSELRLAGLHNAANAMAALALIDAVAPHASRAALLSALRNFRGLRHRVELIGAHANVRYFDDSKGTNVGSTVAALAGFARELAATGGKVVLIAGGDGKGQDFSPLAEPVAAGARALVLLGRDGPRLGAALAATGVSAHLTVSLAEAVATARGLAHAGDIVLLSPACASLDMFTNYKARGDQFAALVQAFAHG